MIRDSSNGRNKHRDFLLIRPAAALVAVGMILPEYLLVVAVSAFLAMIVLAIVQTINHRKGRMPEPLIFRRHGDESKESVPQTAESAA